MINIELELQKIIAPIIITHGLSECNYLSTFTIKLTLAFPVEGYPKYKSGIYRDWVTRKAATKYIEDVTYPGFQLFIEGVNSLQDNLLSLDRADKDLLTAKYKSNLYLDYLSYGFDIKLLSLAEYVALINQSQHL